jgi:hypothetical protein
MIALCLALPAATSRAAAGQARTTKPPAPTPAPDPWPSRAAIAERKRTAENLPLFRSTEPLLFTLTADFRAVDRDRDPSSTKTYPATITLPQPDGSSISRPLRLRGRGHTRRDLKLCDFMPLRLEFDKAQVAGTEFAGNSALKLGTHCRSVSVFEQYVLREYTAYRVFNLLTPYSFRARLARATYVDAGTKRTIGERYAMFLEDADDVAKRMEGRINEQRKYNFDRLEPDYLTLMTLFQYMIGNTDVAITAQHNVRVVETPAGLRYPVPYDFDYAGLVNASYAVVDRSRIRGITTVRERLYLGPCRTHSELEPHFAKMRAVKPEIYALYDQVPGFTDDSRRDAKSYLDGFYRTIDRPAEVTRSFIDTCVKAERTVN